MYDFMIIGGGIVGLSVGAAILEKDPTAKLLILEKEKKLAQHQTGRNSGVIHSGIYYKPGSFKARFAKAGSEGMRSFAEKHRIKHDICGKVIVATNQEELVHLENLYKRGIENDLPIEKLSKEQLLEKEPHVNGLEAIHVPTAGIIDYKEVSEKLAELIRNQEGQIVNEAEVMSINEGSDYVTIETNTSTYQGHYLINCAGLQSDRIAKMAGYLIDMKIVPFRGEYFMLKEEKRHLVKNLIYPVPNPNFPFLGVHFTRMINGAVDVGPNAVPAFKREAYKKTDFHLKDFSEMVTYPGFWKLAMKFPLDGMGEIYRSFVKSKFVQSAQVLLPAITSEDLVPGPAGVRAQALKQDGSLVDDFFIINGKKSIHVCNAPSPAATASLEIGRSVAERIPHLGALNEIIL
ncbi:L-2-hydroxyglutarate oxidase [Jeotgalibacillus proteolyticus]|uniref:L-2-hydroxyglutarate oxidase n=1 Tax=Jeotgalibacillus proteolyticus TaxID=2082395 RepID=A0A2S5GD31_9BACL|nr:L-2-hydroxyglutarate oxidase [Jeotgalibacillus proteolyticus]PPA70825.1 L-2-hydroxyglutarate oxidase [Jeotgalibacillus proteolyticus]